MSELLLDAAGCGLIVVWHSQRRYRVQAESETASTGCAERRRQETLREQAFRVGQGRTMRRSAFASPTAAEIRRRLGIAGVGERRAIDAAARLVEGQRLEAVAAVVWKRRTWVLVASDRRACLVRRPRFVGRARDERFDWAGLTAVRAGSVRLELAFGDRVLKLLLGPEELVHLQQAALRRLKDNPPPMSVDEVRALAHRDLGLITTVEHASTLARVPSWLEVGERVEGLACATLDFDGLLIVTDQRLLLIEIARHPALARAWSVPRHEIRGARPVDAGLWLDLGDRELTLTQVPAKQLACLTAVLPAPAENTGPQPPPLVPIPRHGHLSIVVRRGESGACEFTCGHDTVGRLSPIPGRSDFSRALGAIDGQRLELSCRGTDRSWIGVVETPAAVEPVAGYYPNWLPGGVIAFEQCSYRLRFRYLLGHWRLLDQTGHQVASLRVHALSHGVVGEIDADVRASTGSTPDLVALLISVWAIELERWLGGGGT